MNRPTPQRRSSARSAVRGGFTMIELLMVIVIIAILIALLLPAINAALKTAKNGAVSSEINQIAQALASFKSKYGDYPPSRVYLAENGDYNSVAATAIAPGDITRLQLAQRSAAYLRKFWPRLTLYTASGQGAVFATGSTVWYDFNGDNTFGTLAPDSSVSTTGYVLQGHECLVFFLGGVPLFNSASQTFGLTGFGKDPTNPFLPGATNRQSPLYEFNAGRLFFDGNRSDPIKNPTDPYRQVFMPGYYDSLGNSTPGSGTTINFYVYFSAYGNGIYQPDDVNFPTEQDDNGTAPIGLIYPNLTSAAPNPYSSTLSNPVTGSVTFLNAQSFQIMSAGADGLYGVGGQYLAAGGATSTASNPLQADTTNDVSTSNTTIRIRERDNLTNFKSGTLQ